MRRLALALLLIILAYPALAENSADFQVAQPGNSLFNPEETSPTVVPDTGEVIVVGEFTSKDFKFKDINNVGIKQNGALVPLFVEKKSLFDEFGDGVYVSFRFYFKATEADIDKSRYQLVWGEDVQAKNELAEAITLDPGKPSGYREASFSTAKGGTTASIEIVADSNAELYFLWYLLPMALILAILTVRKLRAGDATNTTSA